MSEERTARLLAEARESIETRGPTPIRDKPLDSAQSRATAERAAPAPIQSAAIESDWRAAAFPDETFVESGDWSSDPVTPAVADAAPFPTSMFLEPKAEAEAVEAPVAESEPVIQPFSGFGGAEVDDALEATSPGFSATPTAPEPRPTTGLDVDEDDFGAETEFVDPRQLRASMGAAAAAGRAASTRSTIDAARAAITAPPEPEPAPRQGFGLKRGGKSKLQERLDRQAARDGSTVKKTFLASVTAVALTGGVYGYLSLTDGGAPGFELPNLGGGSATAGDQKDAGDAAGRLGRDADRTARRLRHRGSGRRGLRGRDRQAGRRRHVGSGGHEPRRRPGLRPGPDLSGPAVSGRRRRGAGRSRPRAASGAAARPRAAIRAGMHLYGMQLYEGDGGATNQSEALSWLLKAAQGGLPDSQYNVARIYETGADGVAKNPTEALKWYMIAARGGDSEAQAAVTRLRPAGQRCGSARRPHRRRCFCGPNPACAADSVAGFRLRHRLRPA